MDKDHIPELIALGSTQQGVQRAQALAKQVMYDNGYGSTLHNACAATLSEFMDLVNINIPITLGAATLAARVQGRGWNKISVGGQRAGDVAIAVNNVHIFLVVQAIDNNQMLVADNQAPGPHPRRASGDASLNHSPTAYFLRAVGAAEPVSTVSEKEIFTTQPDPELFPTGDEDTSSLREPFNDDGSPRK
jgi:hypothetical protein